MIHSRAFREFDPTERLYCSVATAIIGSGVIAGGASIFGATQAANAQTQAAQAAIQNQQQMYGQNKAILSPFIQGGASGIPSLQALLDPNNTSGPLNALTKLTTPGADMSATLAQTPGYQFSLNQGLRSVNNALAARGLGGSGGAVAKGAANFSEGLAGNTWQSVVQALQNNFNSQVSGQQGLVNTGVQAGGALAGVGTNTANSISGSLTGQGNAQAAGYNAIGTGVGTAAGNIPSSLLLSQLLSGGGNNVNGGTSIYGPQQGQITMGGPNGPTPFG